MKIYYFLLVLLLLVFTASPLYADRDDGMVPADGFFLPQGNAADGQKAFMRLKCSACHWVRNNIELNPPVAEKPGPMLGPKQAGYAPGWIANSMVSPSHTLAVQDGGDNLSRMGDFRDSMTVREMIDIVAFIQSLDDEDMEDKGKEAV